MNKNEDSEKIYSYIMAVIASSRNSMVFPGPAIDGRSKLFAFADPMPTKKACFLDKIKHLLRLDKKKIIVIDEDQFPFS